MYKYINSAIIKITYNYILCEDESLINPTSEMSACVGQCHVQSNN